MVNTSTTPPAPPNTLQEIHARNAVARQLIQTFRTAIPTLTDIWDSIGHALSDLSALLTEVSRGRHTIAQTKLDLANLRAAARATLAAHRDGEADPLSYLRDELTAQAGTTAYAGEDR